MRLTVGIPVYNKCRYLRNCINSVLRQDFDDYEVLLWDDGSTDGSDLICDEYASKYDHIRVIHEKNRGPLLARQSIMKEGKGDYLYIFDADDELIDIDFFKCVFSEIEDSCADVVVFRFENEEFKISSYKKMSDVILGIVRGELNNSLCNKVFSRRVVDADLDYSDCAGMRLGEDLIQLIDVLKNANKIVCLNKEFYRIRIVKDSLIHTFNPRYYDSIRMVKKKLLEYLDYGTKKGKISHKKEKKLRTHIDLYTLKRITALVKKIKYVKGDNKHRIKKEYLQMIYNSAEFNETKYLVKYLSLNRRLVVYTLSRRLYTVIIIAFHFF